MADPKERRAQLRHLVGNISMAVIVGLVLIFAERVLELRIKGLRGLPAELVRALIIVAAGVFVARILERYATRLSAEGGMAARQFTMLRYLGRFILYLIIVLAVLAAFGVGLGSVVFGGAFLTVIVGLAGQTVLGNLLAGLALVLFHPFSTGDRITFVTWQYPILMPSYPHESLMPAYVGTVTDVNLLYTYLQLENGLPMAVPNGIVLQAAIQNHAHAQARVVRCRFDVDIGLPPDRVLDEIRGALKCVAGLLPHPAPEVRLIDLSPTTFTVLLRAVVPPFASEEEGRHRMLTATVGVIRSFRTQLQAGPAALASPASAAASEPETRGGSAGSDPLAVEVETGVETGQSPLTERRSRS